VADGQATAKGSSMTRSLPALSLQVLCVLTLPPAARTLATPSWPGTAPGSLGVMGYLPWMVLMSEGLMGACSTRARGTATPDGVTGHERGNRRPQGCSAAGGVSDSTAATTARLERSLQGTL